MMTGMSFNEYRDDLNSIRNWFIKNGFFATIKGKEIVVSGWVNRKWAEDVNGNLVEIR